MIFVQHLESTGTVHTAQHTEEQFSSHHVPRKYRFRARVSRHKPPPPPQEKKMLQPPFTVVGTLAHKHVAHYD